MTAQVARYVHPGYVVDKWLETGAFGLGLGVALGYVPGVLQAVDAPRWSLLAIGIPLLVLGLPRPGMPKWGLLALAYAGVSSIWSLVPIDTLAAFIQLLLCVGAMMIGLAGYAGAIYRGSLWGLGLNSGLAIAQAWGWNPDFIYQVNPSAGLFINHNMLAEPIALVLVWGFYEARWLAWTLVPGLVLPMSRGALAATVLMSMPRLWTRSKVVVILLGLGLALAMVEQKYQIMPGFAVEHNSSDTGQDVRLSIWESTWGHLTPWGHGLGQFNAIYPVIALADPGNQRTSHVHNDLLEWTFELGIVGTALWAWLLVVAWKARHMAWGFVLGTFLLESLVGFPFHVPTTALLGFAAAGAASRQRTGI